jgi:alpha-glucuronidase
MLRFVLSLLVFFTAFVSLHAEDGHDLWLRNKKKDSVNVICVDKSPTLSLAVKELEDQWQGQPGIAIELKIKPDKTLKRDGFRITAKGIEANTDMGLLYGVYELLRKQQLNSNTLVGAYNPSYELRILNHWDNLDGTIERGYSGHSIFWNEDQDYARITDQNRELWKGYARANASVGINGAVLNNVNAQPITLSLPVLNRVKVISDVLRPYGIKVYLSINFSSPAELGGLKTSDPLDPKVIDWWKKKVSEIYKLIPDFGGFLVKANSEGLPGPQDFGRTHAEGANMLANALKPYGGLVMWRAFVYKAESKDRARQAYDEFIGLDGKFKDNVLLQIKNGPIDFQPREPFSPLFGAMKKTSVMPEVQITQEYLGHSIQLVYLAPMWEEFFKSETYQYGVGSTVAKCTDGTLGSQKHTAIAGVANVGLDINWCGHTFAQSNWYAFGRMSWDNTLTSEQIADEWIKLTFVRSDLDLIDNKWSSNFLKPVKQMMLDSREACVSYSMPLGLHHLFAVEHHYGPGPWYAPDSVRPDWTPPYYHKAGAGGIGFDRTKTGSNAVSQYKEPLASKYNDMRTCPEELLLFFHHVPWTYKMQSGYTLWEELCYKYDGGLHSVKEYQRLWDSMESYVDSTRFSLVQSRLRRQCRDAQIWKDGCLLYFQQFSKMPIPLDIERPVYDLKDVMSIDLGWKHHN